MAIVLHACFVTGSLLCKGVTVYESESHADPCMQQFPRESKISHKTNKSISSIDIEIACLTMGG